MISTHLAWTGSRVQHQVVLSSLIARSAGYTVFNVGRRITAAIRWVRSVSFINVAVAIGFGLMGGHCLPTSEVKAAQ
jgi:NO-binding membrane sensor protein with MHYT domain